MQGLRTHIKIMEAVGTTVDTQVIAANEGVVQNAEEIGEAAWRMCQQVYNTLLLDPYNVCSS